MFYYVEPSSVFLKPSFILYKTKVLLKPGLESSVIPPIDSFDCMCFEIFILIRILFGCV